MVSGFGLHDEPLVAGESGKDCGLFDRPLSHVGKDLSEQDQECAVRSSGRELTEVSD